jgi:uncharacterized protein (UPF0335 family)
MAAKKSAKKKPVKAEKKAVQRPKLKLAKNASRSAKRAARPARSRGEGHNSGINAPLVKMFEEYERLDANKKEITKAQSDIRARAKDEHGVAKKNFTHEIALRKLDSAVRVEFEQGQKDLQEMIGYQFNLALLNQEGSEDEGGDHDDSAPVGDHDVEDQNAAAASSELH